MNFHIQRHMTAHARQVLDAQGLKDWQFKFNTNKRRRGVCKYGEKMIEVSVYVTKEGEDAVKEVIAHEVAHAAVGAGHHHNHVWRKKAIELGCSGERCGATMEAPAKYVAVCGNCGKQYTKHRATRSRHSCTPCSGGRFDEKYLLNYKENHLTSHV